MNFEQTPEFKKDLKHLQKKWRSLSDDMKAAERDLLPLYVEQAGVDLTTLRKAFFNGKKATILHKTQYHEIVKMRLDVESLARNDKVRVVFVAVKTNGTIVFIELYAKNEKDREDQGRITKYL